MGADELDTSVAAVRRFNRFFTHRIGLLNEGMLDSPFSLAEVRVMYELAHADGLTAGDLCHRLDLDAGYVSRLLKRLQQRGLVNRSRSPTDGRRRDLGLTAAGREAFSGLDRRSHAEIAALLQELAPEDQPRLVAAMSTIEGLLAPPAEGTVACVIRPHQPGDMGWVVWRHGVLYAREYGWTAAFEALVARIVADFMENFDPSRDRCWIAEREGAKVGSVFLVRDSDEVAKLRLLLVEPAARGLGIGRRLVRECIRTARELGYRRIILWTNSVLDAARHIYQDEGFRVIREEAIESFGRDQIGEYWELDLRPA